MKLHQHQCRCTNFGIYFDPLDSTNPIINPGPKSDRLLGTEDLKALTRYIHECTKPEDRLFIAGFFPDVHFYSARGFAGGQEDFNPDLHSSLRDQRMTIDRLERQSVPIAGSTRRCQLLSSICIDSLLRDPPRSGSLVVGRGDTLQTMRQPR